MSGQILEWKLWQEKKPLDWVCWLLVTMSTRKRGNLLLKNPTFVIIRQIQLLCGIFWRFWGNQSI